MTTGFQTPNTSYRKVDIVYNLLDRFGVYDGPFKLESIPISLLQILSENGYHCKSLLNTLSIGRSCTVIPKIFGDYKGIGKAFEKIVKKQGLSEILEIVYQSIELSVSVLIFQGVFAGVKGLGGAISVLGLTNNGIDIFRDGKECYLAYHKIGDYKEQEDEHLANPSLKMHPLLNDAFQEKLKSELGIKSKGYVNPKEVMQRDMLRLAGKIISVVGGVIAIIGMVTQMLIVSNTILLTMSIASVILSFASKSVEDLYSYKLHLNNEERS